MKRATALVLALTLAAGGCASAHAFRVDGAPEGLEPVPPEAVEVYETADDAPCDYEPLARVEGSGDVYAGRDGVVGAMREKAARLGADALILTGYSDTDLGGALFGGEEENEARGLAALLRCGERAP